MSERPSDPAVWARLRSIIAGLPEVSDRISHGELTWFVGAGRRARQFANTWDHHHDDRLAFWCAAPEGAQLTLVDSDPERFFIPPFVGRKGWVGCYLDRAMDWELPYGDEPA